MKGKQLSLASKPSVQHDQLIILLDGEPQKNVLIADSEVGYVIKAISSGHKVTMRGNVEITLNGKKVAHFSA